MIYLGEVIMALTNRQLDVLDYIKKFIATKGYSPTVREIASGLELKSPSTVQDHLKKLVKNGIITINPNKSRTIELLVQNEYLNQSAAIVKLPILDNAYNGVTKEYLDVPSFMVNEYDSRSLYVYKERNSIYVINKGLVLKDRASLTIHNGLFRIEREPTSEIFGNIISEFKVY